MILHLPVSPIYDKNFIAITLQTSNFFAPYASVTIQSILEHAADDFCYDIIVMTWDMKAETAEKLTAMANGRRNISIRVVDVSNEIESYVAIAKKRSDYERFSATGVIRLLLPELLTEFDKILNLDCDMVLCADAAELDAYDLSEYYMGGVPDTICYVLNRRSGEKQFTDELLFEKLKLDSAADYVNAGLLLLNLKNIRRDFSTDEIMEFAQNDGTFFTCYEQDTFNGLFRKKKLKLPAEWNWLFEPYFYEELKKLPAQDMISSAYIKAAKCQKNIHFVGQVKPWSSANRPFGNTWWFLARKSPLFAEILNRVDIKQNVKLRKTSKVRQKRLLFCAETPFELLTAMNLKYHYYGMIPADIILCDIENVVKYLPALKTTGLFQKYYLSSYNHKRDFQRLQEETSTVTPKDVLGNIALKNVYSDYFMCCAQSVLQKAVFFSLRKPSSVTLHIFEGSLSTYFENLHLRLYYPFEKGELICNLANIYLYSPELYHGFNGEPIIEIPSIEPNSSFAAVSQSVFGKAVLPMERFIFLGDNFEEIGTATEHLKILDMFSDIVGKENIAVKVHPLLSDIYKELYEIRGYHVISDDIVWEMLAVSESKDNHVLITVSSGAVMTPYSVGNQKIPIVVLKNLIRFSGDWYFHTPEYNSYLDSCKKLLTADRVGFFCPLSWEELKKIILYLEGELRADEKT